MIVKAPGVVKLLGEHAVVYGRLSLAIGINRYAKASVSKMGKKLLTVESPELHAKGSFDAAQLDMVYAAYRGKSSIDDYVNSQNIDRNLLPFVTIAARLMKEHDVDPTGLKIRLSSGIPLQKGMASSAAMSTAFAVAILKATGKALPEKDIIDVSRDGDRVIHRSENAGRIDVATSFYGGYTSFSSAEGAKRHDVPRKIKLLVVDTGPKKPTAETVGHVASLYKADERRITEILDRINQCSLNGLNALMSSDIKGLGRYMYEDQELLKLLEVSSEGLNKAVSIAKEHGAHGAKLSGGGGGGIAIVLCNRNTDKIASKLAQEGFSVIPITVSQTGARDAL